MAYIVKIDDKEFKVDIKLDDNGYIVLCNGDEYPVSVTIDGENKDEFMLTVKNRPYTIVRTLEENVFMVNGEEYLLEVLDEEIQKIIKTTPGTDHKKEAIITTPMPGLVIDIEVQEGNAVKQGQGLLIVEAMKMQNEMKAPRDGIVKQILVKKGQTVNSKDKLVIIE